MSECLRHRKDTVQYKASTIHKGRSNITHHVCRIGNITRNAGHQRLIACDSRIWILDGIRRAARQKRATAERMKRLIVEPKDAFHFLTQ